MKIRVVITGRSYHLSAELPEQLELPSGATVDDALAALKAAGAEPPPSCLVAVAGEHVGTVANHASRPLAGGEELVLIAPVAGG